MSNIILDSGVAGLTRTITTIKPHGIPFIPCANLATAQLYASDSTRIGRDAFYSALVEGWEGNAPYYVVERVAPGVLPPDELPPPLDGDDISAEIDALIERIKTVLA